MTTLPDIPRLYTALAEVLAAVLYAQAVPPRMDKRLCWGITVVWAGLLAVFLQLTGDVPLVWWIPCMTAAIGWIYLYLWGTRAMNLLEAGYSCARAFILAKKAAVEAAAAEAAKRGEAEAMLKKLLAEGMSADEIIDKLK